jgi:hypothetical protein
MTTAIETKQNGWIALSGARGMGKRVLVDADLLDRVVRYKWFLSRQGYAVANLTTAEGKRASVSMHRVLVHPPHGLEVDHANGNKLDNRLCNLRVATRTQNNANARTRKHSKSGIKGVRFHKLNKRWQARIRCAGKQLHLGYFDTPQMAAEAYSRAASSLFGEFARTE